MTQDTPDWDRLAQDPEGFFELEGEWDRRDLRRAYGRWIKRYKPDAHPDEFRMIRAGFERLEGELRFQRMDRQPHSQGAESSPGASREQRDPVGPQGPAAEEKRPEPGALIASIAKDGPVSVLGKLQQEFPLWWVPNYLRLFLEGDEPASNDVFERQLVAALMDRPREPVLLNLMRSWVRRRVAAGAGQELLPALRSLPDMTMAVVATPLFKRLAAEGQGEVLEEELRRLERAVHHEGRAAFAAVLEDCLLAAAMVLDPGEVNRWLDEIALDRHGRFDVDEAHAEAASRILHWRRSRALRGDAEPPPTGIIEELEAALMELAVGDEALRLDVLVALGERIRSSTDEIYGQLRPYDAAATGLIEGLTIFGLPLDDGRGLSEGEHVRAIGAAETFLEEMNERTEGSVLSRVWTLLPLMAWTVAAILIAFLVSPLTAAVETFGPAADPGLQEAATESPVLDWLAPMVGLGFTILLLVLRKEKDEPLWFATRALRWAEQRISRFLYRTIWRRKLIDFAVLQPWNGQQLVSVLVGLQDGDGSTVGEEIAEHLAEDSALVLILFGRDLEA